MAAQNIKVTLTEGLFNVGTVQLDRIMNPTAVAELKTDLVGGNDPAAFIVNIPESATGNYTLSFVFANGEKEITCPLTAGNMNVVHFTTLGIKSADGYGYFKLTTDNSAGLAAQSITAGVIKYRAVTNH